MSEAKNLDSGHPTVPTHEPALFDAVAVSDAPEVLLPPTAKLAPLKAPGFGRRLAAHLLAFTLIGLLTFGAGAALTAALFMGSVDQHTGEIKEFMKKLKAMAHHGDAAAPSPEAPTPISSPDGEGP